MKIISSDLYAYAVSRYIMKEDLAILKNTLNQFVTDGVEAMKNEDTTWEGKQLKIPYLQAYVHFVSIKKAKEMDFSKIRDAIKEKIGVEKKFIQVTGSSDGYRTEVTKYLKELLMKYLNQGEIALVYGVTGKGVNSVVNDILENHAEFKKLVVGNLVYSSFEYMDCKALPGHLTYLFGASDRNTEFGDDNDLADTLSDRFIVVGGGIQTLEQMNIALKAGKEMRIVVSKEGSVHEELRLSVGDLVYKAYTQPGKQKQDPEAYIQLLSELYPNLKLDKDRIASYLATWVKKGYLNLIEFNEVD
jgi:phosphoribosylformimino-5-aminoimidazole carboxamide ribonucleotide (ProFAR) isomerase